MCVCLYVCLNIPLLIRNAGSVRAKILGLDFPSFGILSAWKNGIINMRDVCNKE